MELKKEVPFTHNGKDFILKLYATNHGYSVVSFLNNIQVSPSYSVSYETHSDYFMQHEESLTNNLFEIAKSDLEAEMYFKA